MDSRGEPKYPNELVTARTGGANGNANTQFVEKYLPYARHDRGDTGAHNYVDT